MDVPVPQEFGLGAYKDNVGAMVNRGIEVTIGYHHRWGDWSFGANGNFAYNKNKLLDLGGVDSMQDPNSTYKRRVVGQKYNTYYGYQAGGFSNLMKPHKHTWTNMPDRKAIRSIRPSKVVI